MVAKNTLGVDVSKKHLDLHFHPINSTLRIENNATGMNVLLSAISKQKQLHGDFYHIACEATGGYELLMIKTLAAAGYDVWMIEPSRVKAFIASEGKRSKTDKGDARMIALYAAQKERPYQPIKLSKSEEKLRALGRHRQDLVHLKTQIKQRLEHKIDDFCTTQIELAIDFFEAQISALDEKLASIIASDEGLKNKVEIVDSVPGFAQVNATALVLDLPELGTLDRRKIAALAGICPYTQESGSYKGIARTSAGRTAVRKALFLAAFAAKRFDPGIKAFYERLLNAGKKPMIAIVAVMRKLLVRINAMVRDKTMWKKASVA